jgi:hypothetical protein
LKGLWLRARAAFLDQDDGHPAPVDRRDPDQNHHQAADLIRTQPNQVPNLIDERARDCADKIELPDGSITGSLEIRSEVTRQARSSGWKIISSGKKIRMEKTLKKSCTVAAAKERLNALSSLRLPSAARVLVTVVPMFEPMRVCVSSLNARQHSA